LNCDAFEVQGGGVKCKNIYCKNHGVLLNAIAESNGEVQKHYIKNYMGPFEQARNNFNPFTYALDQTAPLKLNVGCAGYSYSTTIRAGKMLQIPHTE